MRTLPLQSGIIYGPIRSRRLGWSLGLNVSPTGYKLCSFNCIYCHYGWTDVRTVDMADGIGDLPAPHDFERALAAALREHQGKEINNITFSGNGEATLHPRFDELVDTAIKLKGKYFPQAKLGVLSNSSAVNREGVRETLDRLDFRIMKLDAGDVNAFHRINRPCQQVSYDTMLDGLKSLDSIILQTVFVDGKITNIGEREINEWMERVGEIQPLRAQIYSLHRPPAESSLREVPGERLRTIGEQTEDKTGVEVEVIVAASPYSRRYHDPYRK